jgi:hypothetical protein
MVLVKAPERLDSWKEIAGYLGKDERTVQRWEAECALPVHRTPGRRRGSVFAFRGELDLWMAGQKAVSAPPATPPVGPISRKKVRIIFGLLIGILLAAVAIVLTGFLSRTHLAVRLNLIHNRVIGLDELGQKRWEYSLREPASWPGDPAKYWRAINLGNKPAFLVTAAHTLTGGGELDCFSADGKLLWQYIPKMTLKFGTQVDEGPWSVVGFDALPDASKPRIWASVGDSIWGHSFVVEIDPLTGKSDVRFVNNGAIYAFRSVTESNRTYLLAGGFNNEYDLPMLAVLDANREHAVSPQTTGTRYFCENCGRGTPLKYFVMPRSELNQFVSKRPNSVQVIDQMGTTLQVSTSELSEAERAIYFYSITPEVLPNSVTLAATYWSEHRQLEREGRLKHPAEKCPDYLNPKPVRMWTAAAGWSELTVEYLPKGGIPEK